MAIELPQTYRLTAAGRRLTLSLMVGAAAVWLFAGWMLGNTLNLSYRHLPSTLGPLVSATLRGRVEGEAYAGLTAEQALPALLLVVLIIALPLMLWNLCEEWWTRYTVTDDGLLYQTVGGIRMLFPWETIRGVQRVDPESDEPVDEIIVDRAGVLQIKSPLLRWLHRMALGAERVPVYADVEGRDELLAQVQLHSQVLRNEVGA